MTEDKKDVALTPASEGASVAKPSFAEDERSPVRIRSGPPFDEPMPHPIGHHPTRMVDEKARLPGIHNWIRSQLPKIHRQQNKPTRPRIRQGVLSKRQPERIKKRNPSHTAGKILQVEEYWMATTTLQTNRNTTIHPLRIWSWPTNQRHAMRHQSHLPTIPQATS